MPYLGREPGVGNNVTGNLKVSGTISAESINHKLALNGSDTASPQANINDHFIFEDGGTDGSGTNAGDNLLLEDVSPSQAEVSLASIAAGGTSGQVLQSQGSLVTPAFAAVDTGYTLGTDTATSSGSAITFGSIPSGVTNLRLLFEDASASGGSQPMFLIQLGDAGGIETSGYVSTALNNNGDAGNSTTGFIVQMGGAGNTMAGIYDFQLKDSTNNTFVGTLQLKSTATTTADGAGYKSLSGELTQIKITPQNAFDNGSINIAFI